jgi:cytochrome P450
VALAQHPSVQERAAAEVQTALAGRVPTIEDLSHLPYTQMVINEALRLYPPAWFLLRKAEQADTLAGFQVQRGTLVFLSPYTLHRHPACWPNPERFEPERFTPEQTAARSRLAYLPFAAGPHQCIGNQFALVELHLAIAMFLQRFQVALQAAQDLQPEALLSLRPKGGRLYLLLQTRPLLADPDANEPTRDRVAEEAGA